MARKNGNGGAAGQGAQAAPPAGAAPQPAQSTQSTPAQGFDPQQIIQALQLVGEYGPGAMVFFQRLLDILRSRAQEVQGREGEAGLRCPQPHLHGCCKTALEHACATVAELLRCECACKPENPQQG
jgi:hypothetical protein